MDGRAYSRMHTNCKQPSHANLLIKTECEVLQVAQISADVSGYCFSSFVGDLLTAKKHSLGGSHQHTHKN